MDTMNITVERDLKDEAGSPNLLSEAQLILEIEHLGMANLQDSGGVWRELEHALLGDNGFGGNVAEIYAHRLMPEGSLYASLSPDQRGEDLRRTAAIGLKKILQRFQELHRDREIRVDGCDGGMRVLDLASLPASFGHRVYVEVMPNFTDDERDIAEARRVLVASGVIGQIAVPAVDWMAEHGNGGASALAWARKYAEAQAMAMNDVLYDLASLVRILREQGGYLTPDDQYALRAASDRLERHVRSVVRSESLECGDALARNRSTR